MKAIQEKYENDKDESVAFVMLNVKGKDLLAIDELNDDLNEKDINTYKMLGLSDEPFKQVSYYYPFSGDNISNTYNSKDEIKAQKDLSKAFSYKYTYDYDKENLDLLFANIDDPTQTMDSIINYIISKQGNFGTIEEWDSFKNEVNEYCKAGGSRNDKEITVSSWRKFKRVINKSLSNPIFLMEYER